MSTAAEEIEAYLVQRDPCDGDRLDAALLLARSMSHELRRSLNDWESAVVALEQLKAARNAVAAN